MSKIFEGPKQIQGLIQKNQVPVQVDKARKRCSNQSQRTLRGRVLKIKSHKKVSSPEKKRRSSSKSSLILSPIRDQSRVEPCHNCGLEMSPAHQCQNDQDFTLLNETIEVKASPTCPGHPIYGPCGCTKWGTPCSYYTPDFVRHLSKK